MTSSRHMSRATNRRRSPRHEASLILLTAFFTAAAANLLTDIAQRFLSGGRDYLSIVRNFVQLPLMAIQTVLLLLVGGTLVEPGRERIEKLLRRVGLFKGYKIGRLLLVSVVALCLMLAVRLSLPYVAICYNNMGTHSFYQKDYTAAAGYYQRAVSLNPDYAEAHYGLGNVYERLSDYAGAIQEYGLAVKLDSRFTRARNKIARLYLGRGDDRNDTLEALRILNEEIARAPDDDQLLYSLYTNRGWANYKLENYPRAEEDLQHAVMLQDKGDEDQGAAANCLLGYTLEKQNKPGTEEAWRDCLLYESGQDDVEPQWVEDAKKKRGEVTR